MRIAVKVMKRTGMRQAPTRVYSKHGLGTLKHAVKTLGARPIDMRTSLGKTLTQWRTDLIADLGGSDAISTQQAAVIDLAVKTKLLLDSIDVWLLQQPSLVNKRTRALLPVVRERQQLADALARYMSTLGLERRAKPVPALATYIEAAYGSSKDGQRERKHVAPAVGSSRHPLPRGVQPPASTT